ncbi:hypothetical protein CHARACLAT_020547 [Characodon lateralis]|uniref:Uncharacterized protein n=1 Tax=Characodon lateralis TaxID=208331 RepID=A0ABU7F5M8_9TELE|nr:hypothetical protein [Characodon lateralis]
MLPATRPLLSTRTYPNPSIHQAPTTGQPTMPGMLRGHPPLSAQTATPPGATASPKPSGDQATIASLR